jgi:hypothetical protein
VLLPRPGPGLALTGPEAWFLHRAPHVSPPSAVKRVAKPREGIWPAPTLSGYLASNLAGDLAGKRFVQAGARGAPWARFRQASRAAHSSLWLRRRRAQVSFGEGEGES